MSQHTIAAAAAIAAVVAAAGPWRALTIWRSVVPSVQRSVRSDVLEGLRARLQTLHGNQYIIVHGPRGAGKTHFVNSVLRNTRCVSAFDIMPGTPAERILDTVYRHFAPCAGAQQPEAAAARVLRILRLSGCRPIVVLRAIERAPSDRPAGLAAAVKSLTSRHELRVIVDADVNSTDESLFCTTRQHAVHVGEMTRAQLRQIPDVAHALDLLAARGLADVAWHVFGGIPSLYLQPGDPVSAMREQLCTAVTRVNLMRRRVPETAAMLDEFQGVAGHQISLDRLPAAAITAPHQDHVFDAVNGAAVPATPALRLALFLGLSGEYRVPTTLHGLQKLVL